MNSLPDLILKLRSVNPNCSDYVMLFEYLLAEIISLRNPDAILALFSLFDDQAPYDELMFSIIHGIESFEDEIYVKQALIGAVDFCVKSPRWASIVFMRMLNSDTTRFELVRQLRDADPSIKTAIKNLMEKINARGVQFISKTTAVIVAASI